MDTRRKNSSAHPEASPSKKMSRGKTSSQESQGEPSIVEKLVNMWKAKAHFTPVFSQESSEDVRIKQLEEKCASLDQANNKLQINLASSEAKAAKLAVDLMNEGNQHQHLVSKMTTVWDYMKSITETINYVTETMDDCKGHSTRLTSEYNEVIMKLYKDNDTLKSQAECHAKERSQHADEVRKCSQKEIELAELKPKYQILVVEMENYKKKLGELGESERRLQKRILDLEATAGEEKRRLELMCAAEAEKLSQQRHLHEIEAQKFLKEIDGLKEKFKDLQDEKKDVFRLLAEKGEEIKGFEQAVDDYKTNLEELKTELAEQTSRYQRVTDEMMRSEAEMLEKNKQVSELTQQVETVQLELSRKTVALASLEEAKTGLEQEIVKKELQSQETQTKSDQVEMELRRRLFILEENLSQKTSELQELEKKWEEADSQRESVSTDLLKSTVLLEAVQKENVEIKRKLNLISSSKEGEVGDLKHQLEVLNKQMEERQLIFIAKNQEMKLKYEEAAVKYKDEVAATQENYKTFTAEVTNLNAKLEDLQQINKQHLMEKEKLSKQFNSSELKLKKMIKSEGQLKEKLQAADENKKISDQTIESLKQKNQQLETNNQELMKMEKKLKTVERRAEVLQQKYYDADADFNEKIRNLQQELDAAKRKLQEASDERFLTRSESFQKHQKNLEASEKRAQEFEHKYYALQEAEKQRFEKQQRLTEEATIKAQEYKENSRKLEAQLLEYDNKLANLEQSLQDPQLLSPVSWRNNQTPKKVIIRSDETFPPGTFEEMLPPSTPKQPVKSILKGLVTPPVPARKPQAVSQKPPLCPKSNINDVQKSDGHGSDEPSRSSSPDSSAMIVDDEYEKSLQIILSKLSQEKGRSKPTTPPPKGSKKFFKNKGSQPK
ncbi:CAP-Gly domain-containing linker protein 1-like [Diachasmimorpha longicaudata]|uniref:CAP-Gly domain-containing linker protein 1-like n=1 Tax=Diachasmimorpha longicaudata TaxID=58733 RepID=UPI0030B8A0B1